MNTFQPVGYYAWLVFPRLRFQSHWFLNLFYKEVCLLCNLYSSISYPNYDTGCNQMLLRMVLT